MVKEALLEYLDVIIENYKCGGKDCGTFYSSLISLRKYIDASNFEEEIYDRLIKLVYEEKSYDIKKLAIDVITQLDMFTYKGNEELITIYIEAIKSIGIRQEFNYQCLMAFIDSGLDVEELFGIIVDKCNRNEVVELMINIPVSCINAKSELIDIMQEIDTLKKIRKRAEVLSTFILLTYPICKKYNMFNFTLSNYPDFITAASDWGWNNENNPKELIEIGVISKREGGILGELGSVLEGDIDLSENIRLELYNRFFESRNVFDVIYTLPENNRE